MTILTLARSMLDGICFNLTENEFKLLQIPPYRILKRREFSNIYKTLILYLTKLSIPKAFPKEVSDISKLFNELYDIAYEGKDSIKKEIENDLQIFQKLTDFQLKDPFIYVARDIVERFEKRPRKALFISMLNDHINLLFTNFINIGNRVELINDPEDENIINELKKKN